MPSQQAARQLREQIRKLNAYLAQTKLEEVAGAGGTSETGTDGGEKSKQPTAKSKRSRVTVGVTSQAPTGLLTVSKPAQLSSIDPTLEARPSTVLSQSVKRINSSQVNQRGLGQGTSTREQAVIN